MILRQKRSFAYGWRLNKICMLTSLVLNAETSSPTNKQCVQHFQPTPILDLKQIKHIIELMKRSELTEFAVEEEGFKLKIRRGMGGLPVVTQSKGSSSPFVQAEPSAPAPSALPHAAPMNSSPSMPPIPMEEQGITYIKSPM